MRLFYYKKTETITFDVQHVTGIGWFCIPTDGTISRWYATYYFEMMRSIGIMPTNPTATYTATVIKRRFRRKPKFKLEVKYDR